MVTSGSLTRLALALSLSFASGCTTDSVNEDDVGAAMQPVVTAVDPVSEESPGPDGHILRLDRPVNGFDALPSPTNDSGGAHFSAPCGCIYLALDGLVTYNEAYIYNDPLVTFPYVLEEGVHDYQAVYAPRGDYTECVGPWVCPGQPGPGVTYFSGIVTVTVELTSEPHKHYPNRCKSCPAWCDPSHHLHDKMVKKFPSRCDSSSIGTVTYPHSCGEPWACQFVDDIVASIACVQLPNPIDNDGGNPLGLTKLVRTIIGRNTCYDKQSEKIGGSVAWYADWKDDIVSCPSFVAPYADGEAPFLDITVPDCCDLSIGECAPGWDGL